jgi:phage minor structural protein
MDLTILDGQTEDVLAVLNDVVYGPCPFWGAQHYIQVNGESTFTFSVPGDHPDSQYVIEGNLVAFKDKDEGFQLFEIVKMEEDHGDEVIKKVTCEHQFITEMNDEFISYLVVNQQDASATLDAILAFGTTSRWAAGTIATTNPDNTKVELASKTEAIYSLTQIFDLEWQFRVTLGANGRISGRFIDLVSQLGSDNGKRFEYSKDIVSLERNVETYELKTALYGYGKAQEVPGGIRRLDFGNVIWTVVGGDPADKPAMQTYVEDPVAKAAYGRASGTRNRLGYYSNPDQLDPVLLLEETWAALQSNNSPRLEYKMTALDLEVLTGFGFEAVRIGDTVKVIDHVISPVIEFETRIMEITYDYSEPEKTQVTLQNETRKITFTDGSKIQQQKFTIDNRQGVWEENAYSGNMLKDHSFELMRTTETTPDAEGTYAVARPMNTNINTWYWGNTTAPSTKTTAITPAPRFTSEFLNGLAGMTQENRTPNDFQAIVVGTSRRNPKQLAFINETLLLNGPYSYSAYIASFPGTTRDGKARLEIWATDLVGGVAHRISQVGVADFDLLADSATWYNWKRVAIPNIRNLPADTVYLEVSLTQEPGNPGMRYLADAVQLTPTEQPVTYQPESALWGSQNGVFGYFNRNTYIQAYPSSKQITPAGTSFALNLKKLSTQFDPSGVTQAQKINDPLKEWSTSLGIFRPRRNGIYHIDCSVRWGMGITGGLVEQFVEVNGINRAALSYMNTMETDSMTNGSVTMYIESGSTVRIVGFASLATTINSSERMTRLRIKRMQF